MNRVVLLLFVLLYSSVSASAAELAKDGATDWAIVLPDEWGGQMTPSVRDWKNPSEVYKLAAQQKKWGKAPRGCELFLVDGEVVAFDRLLYSPKQYWVGRYFPREWMQAKSGDAIVRSIGNRLARIAAENNPKLVWETKTVDQPRTIAVGTNALVIAGLSQQPPDRAS